ncbi:TPA: hypothetical protein DDZ86_00685 [Candidatus Dependentiae bacterium]|nr:MAG: hypothetical protein UW09_C0004G0016 [candidate division TM6 bacterium GW2011_GWF2_43_87]HBL98140.1 hypothetical protein [Candidatus Dependentiae bacterium]
MVKKIDISFAPALKPVLLSALIMCGSHTSLGTAHIETEHSLSISKNSSLNQTNSSGQSFFKRSFHALLTPLRHHPIACRILGCAGFVGLYKLGAFNGIYNYLTTKSRRKSELKLTTATPLEPKLQVPIKNFFEYITGMSESTENLSTKLSWHTKADEAYIPLGVSYTPGGPIYIKNTQTGKEFRAGTFEVLSLNSLRQVTQSIDNLPTGTGTLNFIISQGTPQTANDLVDIATQLADPNNAGDLFVGASNFNCLEGIDGNYSPVSSYPSDPTQGPRMSNNAGAIVRDHLLAFINGHIGQVADKKWVRSTSGNSYEIALFKDKNIKMKNGYLVFNQDKAKGILTRLQNLENDFFIGYHKGVEIAFGKDHNHTPGSLNGTYDILNRPEQIVDQAYVAALNLNWNYTPECNESTEIAKLILQYSYEAVLRACAAQGKTRIHLPLVGCGVFGNQPEWIIEILKNLADFIKKSDMTVEVNLFCEKRSNGNAVYQNAFLTSCKELAQKTGGTFTTYLAQ